MRSCDIAAAASLRISVFSVRERENEREHGGEREAACVVCCFVR